MAKAWLLTVLVLAYVPWINWRWHLLNGIQIPLALLATQGLRRTAFRWILLRRRQRAGAPGRLRLSGLPPALAAAMALVAAACCLSSLNLLLSYRAEVAQVTYPTYLPTSEVAALDWMRRELPRDALVLAAYPTGNYVPRLSGQRVFLGEDKLTAALEARQADVAGFFSADEGDARRVELLRRFGVDYLFYGPDEKRLGPYDPALAPFLHSVYDRDGMKIFRVEGIGARSLRAASPARPGKGGP